MKAEKEPRDLVSANIDKITQVFYESKVMLPQGATKKLLLALGSGKLRFIHKDDVPELHPILAKDPSLMR